MIVTAIALLSLSGVFGLCLFLREKHERNLKMLAHTVVVVTGLSLLLTYSFGEEKNPVASTVLFGVAACGGFVTLLRDLAEKYTPGWIAALHAVISICGFALLFVELGN